MPIHECVVLWIVRSMIPTAISHTPNNIQQPVYTELGQQSRTHTIHGKSKNKRVQAQNAVHWRYIDQLTRWNHQSQSSWCSAGTIGEAWFSLEACEMSIVDAFCWILRAPDRCQRHLSLAGKGWSHPEGTTSTEWYTTSLFPGFAELLCKVYSQFSDHPTPLEWAFEGRQEVGVDTRLL